MNTMYKNLLLVLLLGFTAGCGSSYVPLRPNVHVEHRTFTLVYAEDGTTLSLDEQHRMNLFFRELKPLSAEQIRIIAPQKSQAGIAAAAQLKSWYLSQGFTSGTLRVETDEDQPLNQLTIAVEYAVAGMAEPCGKWSDDPPNYRNKVWANYGCANARNLASQVDNARDLERGYGGNNLDGDLNQVSMTKYKTDTVAQTVKDSASGK